MTRDARLDRGVGACTDFYQFANGGWRAANPIPPSLTRWSRRWAAGEAAKERLKDILDEVSATRSWAPGSVEQLIGDHYASCMDEPRVEALGLDPVGPLLGEIDAVRDAAGHVLSRQPRPVAGSGARSRRTRCWGRPWDGSTSTGTSRPRPRRACRSW